MAWLQVHCLLVQHSLLGLPLLVPLQPAQQRVLPQALLALPQALLALPLALLALLPQAPLALPMAVQWLVVLLRLTHLLLQQVLLLILLGRRWCCSAVLQLFRGPALPLPFLQASLLR
jgi:hypothetical protein